MFEKILLCLDDTPVADQVAQMGADMAQRYSAELVLLSVLDSARFAGPPYSGLEAVRLIDRHTRSLTNNAQRIEAMLQAQGMKTEFMLLPGRTVPTITAVARETKVDLIVMGGETKNRLRSLLEGSLWMDVMRKAPCSVLRVGDEKKQCLVLPPRQGEAHWEPAPAALLQGTSCGMISGR